MALHRDIYWVGRQWAVTGYGMQAVDPKLKGQFDIEASRLWDDGLAGKPAMPGHGSIARISPRRLRWRGRGIRSRRERSR